MAAADGVSAGLDSADVAWWESQFLEPPTEGKAKESYSGDAPMWPTLGQGVTRVPFPRQRAAAASMNHRVVVT